MEAMKGNNFNENTRVQVPAALHLCRLGYTYLDDIPEYDKRTNIITPIFKQSIKKLNPTMTDLDVSQLLEKIVSEAKNDNLGREFYEMLSSNSGIKLIDFDDPYQNSWHITTEFTCVIFRNGRNALLRIRLLMRSRSARIPSRLLGFFTSINASGKPFVKHVISGRKLSPDSSSSQVNSVVIYQLF